MTDVHRPRRVGTNELDQDALRRGRSATAEALATIERGQKRAAVPGRGEEHVEEPRTRDLEAL